MTAAFWKISADRKRDPKLIHHTVRMVTLADWIFTLPGVALIIISGFKMATDAEIPLFSWGWFSLSLLLFALTSLLWGVLLLPLQYRLIRLSAQLSIPADWKRYQQASRKWAIAGVICTLLPLIILYLMISKTF
ncbi:DUF2269 family protein [Mechercharimyces sp. CAU 1602]|uniref:DUF2269 family protein n=1 Tax=Mechercharimyces sp. CAU 1602 TaxID=2973933 RepID=UPI00286806DB|nr:DUF2269 family protein [Mechercharimyces sp. CAU 1602]